jgi:hypothetical protein
MLVSWLVTQCRQAETLVSTTRRYNPEDQHFMEPEGSLSCSEEPATGPNPEPDESNPHPETLFLSPILILSSHLRLGLPSGNLKK